jgi:pimeloyl-ACP methyl ester carboxylesterase
MSDDAKPATLRVAGATLYYETRGAGPLLLMVPGGPADAGIFAGVAARLADHYTVAAYDPRGNSRSVLAGAGKAQSLDEHGEDAARLIEALTDGPACVFGSSGGGQIGLNLAARHPERVRVLVAHEPPCVSLLPDAAQVLAATQAVSDAYRERGVPAAMQKFAELSGLGGPPRGGSPPPPEVQQTLARIDANVDYFLATGFAPISRYAPDVAALRSGAARVFVGIGEQSTGQLAHRCAVALAAALGSAPVAFPGDHGGFGPHAEAFASTLHRVLRSA